MWGCDATHYLYQHLMFFTSRAYSCMELESGLPSELISDVYILPTPRRQRAAQATTIAPRWQTLRRQHGRFGGTLARIFGPRIWRGRRTPFKWPSAAKARHRKKLGQANKIYHTCPHRYSARNISSTFLPQEQRSVRVNIRTITKTLSISFKSK